MERKPVALDSCVIFQMLEYDQTYKKNGYNALMQKIYDDENNYKMAYYKLNLFMTPYLKANERNLPFYKKLTIFGRLTGKNTKLSQNEINKYNKLHSRYCDLHEKHGIGKLYKLGIDKKVEFIIPPTVFAEINYHKDSNKQYAIRIANANLPAGEKPIEEVKSFPDKFIDDMISNCTLLTFENKKELELIDKLAEIFRGEHSTPETAIDFNGNGKKAFDQAMKPDINKLGMYGDSLIMAETAFAGLPTAKYPNIILSTRNGKDFIFDKGQPFDASQNYVEAKRRNQIKKILTELNLDPNALAYYPEEVIKILEGKNPEVLIKELEENYKSKIAYMKANGYSQEKLQNEEIRFKKQMAKLSGKVFGDYNSQESDLDVGMFQE